MQRYVLYTIIGIACAVIAIGVFYLNQNTPQINQENTSPPVLASIRLTPWAEDPRGGIQVNKTYDPGTIHQIKINGTIHRGTYFNTTSNRTYIYATYSPGSHSQCQQSAWYSYVFPTVSIGGNQIPHDSIPRGFRSFTDSAGTTITFDEWNADTQKDYQKQNKGKLPPVTPGTNTFPLPQPHGFMGPPGPKPIPPGFPYAPQNLPPGAPEQQGFADSPLYGSDFAGNLYKNYKYPNTPKETNTQPPDSTDTITFSTTGATYLYCIKPMLCIGYFTWTFEEVYDIAVTWTPVSTALTPSWNPVITLTPHVPQTVTMSPWHTQC